MGSSFLVLALSLCSLSCLSLLAVFSKSKYLDFVALEIRECAKLCVLKFHLKL
ncbi:hypothetical protein GLYMA_04G192350v4 [Glycine max]|nr:hypothetical protein GLYMA_04G192350v4 [Glycine max]KAH1112110.1 hypothetical protein GYH30_010445 [Glycine max]